VEAARRLIRDNPKSEGEWADAYSDPDNPNPRRRERLVELAQRSPYAAGLLKTFDAHAEAPPAAHSVP
jgi:hypothetical protein